MGFTVLHRQVIKYVVLTKIKYLSLTCVKCIVSENNLLAAEL